jgi:hypothetical protein
MSDKIAQAITDAIGSTDEHSDVSSLLIAIVEILERIAVSTDRIADALEEQADR